MLAADSPVLDINEPKNGSLRTVTGLVRAENFYISLINLISRKNSDIIFIERMRKGDVNDICKTLGTARMVGVGPR